MGTHAQSPHDLLGRHQLESRIRLSPARRWRFALAAIALVLGGALVVLLIRSSQDAERRAVQRMAAEQRRVIFAETRRNAELLCAQAAAEPALADRCSDTARFLLAFPECDASCATFARKHEHKATR